MTSLDQYWDTQITINGCDVTPSLVRNTYQAKREAS
jgi:hypothetical protein